MDHHRSIGSMLRHWAGVRPDAPAVAVEGVAEHTFASWLDASSRLAGGLAAHGVGPGSRVGFIGKNAVTWAEVLAAASFRRAAAIPFNWRLSADETTAVLADADVAVLVVEAEFLPLLGRPVPGDGGARVLLAGGDERPYDAWLAEQDAVPALEPEPDDIAFLIYTSGTSGRPKGVELPNRAIASNLAAPAPWDIAEGHVVMVPAPIFHLSGTGWIFYCLGLGATSLYVLDIRPDVVLGVFAGDRVDHALTVPAVVQSLVQHPDAAERSYPRLRTLIYGGSPMSPTVADAARELFDCDLIQSYGMTETCGPITFLGPDDHRRGGERLASAGVAVPGVELGVFDPATGERCPVGETGEVWTRSALIMAGYRNQPGELSAVLREDGWFRTGDAGYQDADGYLFLCDRVKDMIVSGGENIYPVEVENVLMTHPDVRDVAVIGVPDERWGETVKAVVIPGARRPDPAELVAHCRERLAHYKCPTSVDLVEALPRNPSGKLLKRELRAPYWAGRSREIA
ncbi:AMP-binding protein [Pimelobacter simplex]|uniref:AMP-binding protein n=1 Tax=Nocardioides simplex TaxID=2045 RepID=A0A7J5E2P8_NOCSI|nr:AMP-binding protein [Pimelobacter simplex]KAB2812555.1 AMP-binding protein [Pimelobacter simplex]